MNPKNQTNEEIVDQLLVNEKHQYTESAHAEIFRRLINTISDFNSKAAKLERIMLFLAAMQVILALTQIILALK